jgi:hypothetical protein
MMITVPKDVVPLVRELAEMQGIPEATLVRNLIKEIAPMMRVAIENLRKLEQGDTIAGLMGFSAAMMRMQQDLAAQGAESFDEISKAILEPQKKARAKTPRKAPKKAVS